MLRTMSSRIGILLVMLLPGMATAGPIGAQVLAQVWDPRNPQQQNIQIPYDHNSAVSDAVLAGWSTVRNVLCGPVTKWLGKGDLLAKGITLYNIECRLPDGDLTATQNGARGLTLRYQVKDVHFAATSTTADFPCGKECDPRFSLRFDVVFELGLALQVAGDALKVTAAKVEVSNALLDSHNWSADIAKWFDDNLVPLLRGNSFRSEAQNALNSVKQDFANAVNPKLAPLNSNLRAPQGMVQVGLWARPNKIYVALAPTEWVPPTNGSISGRVFWKSAATANQPISNCTAFKMEAIVQTGPAPITDPVSRSVGIAPTRWVGSVTSGSPLVRAGDAWQCQYMLGGLPAGIPVQVSAHTPANVAGAAKSSQAFVALRLEPVGWDRNGRTVVDGGSGRDWEVKGHYVSPPGIAQRQRVLAKDILPDPAPDRVKQVTNPAVIKTPPQPAPTTTQTSPAKEKHMIVNPKNLPQQTDERPAIK